MWMIFSGIVFGLLSLSSSDNPTVKSRSCSYMGVFHVEGRARYNLTYKDAKRLCEHLSATLAPMDQLQRAYNAGLQTCRYGWINNSQPVILRHKPHQICAGNQIGIMTWEKTHHADAFCYDENDLSGKNCSARSGIYLPGSKSSNTSDGDSASAEDQSSVERTDHENATEVTHLENATTSESTTAVYWTTNGSASVNTSQGFIENNETDETEHPQSTPVKPDTDATRPNGPQSDNKNNSDATEPNVHQSPIKESSDWLVILFVILAVLLILLVCALVATRKRWCGKKRTLIITKKSSSDKNGRSASFTQKQEMTTLMNTEKNLSA
nr:CD44 antigen-like isoform X2 [Misgurnus anguillicaudatus]